MGRDWLMLNLEISFKSPTLFEIVKAEVNSKGLAMQLVKGIPEVFSDKLGVYKSDPAQIKLKFFKPQSFPFL